MLQGKLDDARKMLDQALATQHQLGEMESAAATRVALAELDCDSGRAGEAEALTRAAMQVFEEQKEPNDEMFAAAILSRSLLEQGKREEAAAVLEAPLKLAEKSSTVTARLSVILAHAEVLAATNHLTSAERAARLALAEAPKDLFHLRLEASLALAEIQTKGMSAAEGRRRFEEVARTAQAKGFELIARRAAAGIHR
jgi:tetratricopeptide (TPR) repeat protein